MAVACDRLFSGLVPTTEGYMYAAAVGMLIAMLHAGAPRQSLSFFKEKFLLLKRTIVKICAVKCLPCQESRQGRGLLDKAYG